MNCSQCGSLDVVNALCADCQAQAEAQIIDNYTRIAALEKALGDIVRTCNVRIDDPRCKFFDAARALLDKVGRKEVTDEG